MATSTVRGVLVVLAVALGAVLAAAAPAAPDKKADYIVVLRSSVPSAGAVAREHEAKLNGRARHVYESALKGFAMSLNAAQVEKLSADPRVAYVELDAPVSAEAVQSPATWGLDRSDQRALPLNNSFAYSNTGAGVTAYVIDTGVRLDHAEFGGRAVSGLDVVDGGSADDCNGHGTHVAGTVGGATYGVAKDVTLVAVRVLNCAGSGSTSGVIAGVDWVTAQHDPGQPAVANMSLGGNASSALDQAVNNSINDGVAYAVAAGNGFFGLFAMPACYYSPARVPAAMTISATRADDRKASWANYGSCVDWFAPGVSITSSWHSSSTATNTISGTSMATPHVSGVAALYLQSSPSASPAETRAALFDATTKGVVTASNTPNNHLLFTDW